MTLYTQMKERKSTVEKRRFRMIAGPDPAFRFTWRELEWATNRQAGPEREADWERAVVFENEGGWTVDGRPSWLPDPVETLESGTGWTEDTFLIVHRDMSFVRAYRGETEAPIEPLPMWRTNRCGQRPVVAFPERMHEGIPPVSHIGLSAFQAPRDLVPEATRLRVVPMSVRLRYVNVWKRENAYACALAACDAWGYTGRADIFERAKVVGRTTWSFKWVATTLAQWTQGLLVRNPDMTLSEAYPRDAATALNMYDGAAKMVGRPHADPGVLMTPQMVLERERWMEGALLPSEDDVRARVC